MTRSNVSNHLSCLRGCGLVAATYEGRQVRYALADPHLARALGELVQVVLAVDPTEQCVEDQSGAGTVIPVTAKGAVLGRRVQLLVTATIAHNVIEAVIAISAGTHASSTALIGFGLDSVIEVAFATAVAWQFSGADPQARERTALTVIAVSFFVLAA